MFIGTKVAPLGGTSFGTSIWPRVVYTLGLKGLRVQDLRGCAATMAAMSGATLSERVHRLEHARPEVAVRYLRAKRPARKPKAPEWAAASI